MKNEDVSSRKSIGKGHVQTLADFGEGGIIGGEGGVKKIAPFFYC